MLVTIIPDTPYELLGDKLRQNTLNSKIRQHCMLTKYVPVLYAYLTEELTKFSNIFTTFQYTANLDHTHSLLRREGHVGAFLEEVPETLSVEARSQIFEMLKEKFVCQGLTIKQVSQNNEIANVIIINWD